MKKNEYQARQWARTYRPRRKRMRIHSTDILGQCSTCLDTFTVTIVRAYDELIVQETPRLRWITRGTETYLIHHPDLCRGKVKLYGSLEGLYPQPVSPLEPTLA